MDRSRERTRRVYDRIAEHFSSTREHPWPEVSSFLDGRSGAVGLDVGCGNGRHAQELAGSCDRVVGVDASRGLLDAAADRAEERAYAESLALVQGDASRLPLATDSVDLAVYVATLHHLPDRERRVRSLDELARVLSPDGAALVSAWSTAHDTFEDASADDDVGFDTTVDWTLPGGETVPRYYHVYSPPEFERDLASSALAAAEPFQSSGNCYSLVKSERKTS
ncbi:class I SAM-dependent methyltransferase [Halorubellus sp. PRR65]|uniref:class I SAM-dependent methyltransferase n=1 Tax=Halorubellus sp. PRR65 TaxID=3098148 RepID=UPI002B25C0CC|nr:class I SAM-dependent methyltransferase [Halorubellus sp. PRR65]